jgi:hypothetical protein
MWPNKVADGNTKTSTPGILTDYKENELEESLATVNASNKAISVQENSAVNSSSTLAPSISDEFPMLDELDRLAKMSKFHTNGQLIKQDWLDKVTLNVIQKTVVNEKEASKFFFLTIDLAQIKCDDLKYNVLYYEEVIRLHCYLFFFLIYILAF